MVSLDKELEEWHFIGKVRQAIGFFFVELWVLALVIGYVLVMWSIRLLAMFGYVEYWVIGYLLVMWSIGLLAIFWLSGVLDRWLCFGEVDL